MNLMGNNELDIQLKQLVFIAQQHPRLSQVRQKALGKLVQTLLNSGRLCRPQRYNFSQRYEEIYEEAQQDLFLYICQNIERYEPGRGEVIAWCNTLLERRFFREAIPRVMNKPDVQRISLSDLDNLPMPEKPSALAELLREYIELDPENLFKKTHITDYPEANFQALTKLKLKGMSWKEISSIYNIKISTLSGFYQRCLGRFVSNIKKALENT